MTGEIRKEWRELLLTNHTWRRAARPVPHGEGGGFFVESEEGKHLAYLKPVKPTRPCFPRAAYEKIASDLAFELCLNVPPAVLHVRNDSGNGEDPVREGEETHVVLSLVPDAKLDELREHAASDLIRESLLSCCGTVAFDAWLGNVDRGFERNILLNYDDPARIWFIDYCLTMDYNWRWQREGYQRFERLKVPSLLSASLRGKQVIEVADRIQSLDSQVIREICGRLHDAFLAYPAQEKRACEHRRHLPDWLIWRKSQLVKQMDAWYPAGM